MNTTNTTSRISISVYANNRLLHENIHSPKQVHEKGILINIAAIQRMITQREIQSIK